MFAVSQPGLEQITATELRKLGMDCVITEGGVEFSGGLMDLYMANLWTRTANRILVRVGKFRITELSKVAVRFSRYPWELYGIGGKQGQIPDIRVTSHKSRLYHTGAVAQRALQGIEKRTGPFDNNGHPESPRPLIITRIARDRCTLSIDSSGLPLHMRGYRVMGVRAPLRENLAAALLIMSGWSTKISMCDPFCGSGTIPIEAAMIAAHIPPGLNRKFAFMKWKNFDAGLWSRLRDQALDSGTVPGARIYARDADVRAVRASAANAEAAGVSDFIRLEQMAFSRDTTCPENTPGWIVTNPPYGRRISGRQRQRQDIYRELAGAMRAGCRKWGLTCLVPSSRNNPLPGLEAKTLATFTNGGLRVKVVQAAPAG